MLQVLVAQEHVLLKLLCLFLLNPFASQVDRDARPSVSVNIRRSLEEFLKTHSLADGIDTIQKLQSDCGIKLTMTGKEDPDGIDCFVHWRIAFYVAGGEAALVNFFMFLDNY